jgi:hypothetical protein
VGNIRRNFFRKKWGIKANEIVIGRVGQQFDGKWSTLLIDLFEKLRRSDIRIRLLVVNPPRIIIEKIRKSLFKAEIVVIDEISGDETLSECYSSIDIFVLLADQGESFGMVIAESLLCETPVVSLSTPWGDNSQGEVIGNRVGGYIANNYKECLLLVKKMVDDPNTRKNLGTSGRKRVIELYDSKKIVGKSLAILNSNYLKPHIIKKPINIMKDTEGELSFMTKAILRTNNYFWAIRFTVGYAPYRLLIPFLVQSLKKRILINK